MPFVLTFQLNNHPKSNSSNPSKLNDLDRFFDEMERTGKIIYKPNLTFTYGSPNPIRRC